ncbi:MAG: hypothetical protein HQM12_16650 [SAR324 cluster bacterium]|nr:hypothetical protein [SAR324 cluster bacterium]
MRRLFFIGLAFLLSFLTSVQAQDGALKTSTSPTSQADYRYGGSLIFRTLDEVENMDPPRIESDTTYKLASNVFEGLVRYQGETNFIEPALAQTWEVSKDQLRWTFFLRKDVVFHDGSPVDGEAVLFSFQRQRDSKHPYFSKDFIYDYLYEEVESIQQTGKYSIEFKLKRPYSPFLHILTMPPAAIVSPKAVKLDPENFGKHPVGAGPFKVGEWSEKAFVLEAFDKYWEGRPFVDRVVVQPANYLKAMLLNFRQGNLHLARGVTVNELLWVKGDSDILTKQVPANQVNFFMFNTKKEILKNKQVRRALQYVVRKDAMIRWLWQDSALPSDTIVPPNSWSFREPKHYQQDLDKVKTMLSQAGYPEGIELTLLAPVLREEAWTFLQEYFIAACEKAGIHIKLQRIPFKEYVQELKKAEYDIVWVGWSVDHGDPDSYFTSLLHSKNAYDGNLSNLAYYKNEEVDKLMDNALVLTEPEQRKKLYFRIQEILEDDPPWIPLMVPKHSFLYHRSVENVMVSVTGRLILEKMWLVK